MRRVDITYRITKIGKHAVSVAVCGLMSLGSGVALGTTFDVQNAANRSIFLGVSADSVDVIFAGGAADTFQNTSNITVTLDTGVNLTGQNPPPTGLDGQYAIFTRQVRDGNDNSSDSVRFSQLGTVGGVVGAVPYTSTLNLSGNNDITGIVGVHLVRSNGGINSYSPASVQADPLTTINISGSSATSVTFNRAVFANSIELTNATFVTFLGNIGGSINGGATEDTTIDLNGHDATLNFGNITLTGSIQNNTVTPGDRSNGSLIFSDAATITGNVGDTNTGVSRIQVNGSGRNVSFGGNVSSNQLNYGASANVTVNGDLLMTVDAGPADVLGVTFSGTTGTLNIVGGSLTGVAGQAVVTNSTNNRGTLTFTGDSDGTTNASTDQRVTGQIGESGRSIAALNVGGSSTDNHAVLTVDGDIFATSVLLQNDSAGGAGNTFDSRLLLSTGRNLTGAVTTDSNGQGDLTLLGGSQTVTGTVGAAGARLDTVTSGNAAATSASIFTGDIYASTVTNVGGASSGPNISTTTYRGDVFAGTVNIGSGVSTFEQGLQTYGGGPVTSINIGTGIGNFNVNSTPPADPFNKTTTGNIAFTGAGTANLHTGLTGAVAYADKNATVNLWHNRSISGAVSTTTNAGIFNSRGAGVLSSTVGASGLSIQVLNVNTNNEQTGAANDATRFLLANGNIFATTINLQNDGELRLSDGVNATGNITTAVDNTGVLTLLDNNNAVGTNTVSGNVGAVNFALRQINAGSTNESDTFTNGIVRAQTLTYQGDGSVTFNGTTTKATTTVVNGSLDSLASDLNLGFVGTVNFVTDAVSVSRAFVLGSGVDLITQYSTLAGTAENATSFTNAIGSTLTFAGSSVVVGQLGSGTLLNGAINTWGSDTFKTINAGADGATVTFLNDVYALPSTFNVTGTGIVNFVGDLNTNLRFQGNGSVNVADNQNINGTVTTTVSDPAGTGTVNFVGSATTRDQIGESDPDLYIRNVNFHQATTDGTALPVTNNDATVNIGHNIYAVNTRIGTNQNANANATAATISANVFLGNQLTLAASNVTLNTAGSVTTAAQAAVDAGTAISLVDFTHTKNANGTLTNTAAVTQSTFGAGAFTTSGGTLNFAIGTTGWADPAGAVQGAGGDINTATSSRITGAAGSTLVMTGTETVNLSLLGSLRNNQAYTLVNVQNGGGVQVPLVLRDNSFVIDTALTRAGDGDLVVTATRGATAYISKSATTGHFSNSAALRFGTLAADGQDYSQDMQTVFNILDIDQWGFGNNQANLSTQVRRLAPVANNSYVLSAFRAASLVGDSIGTRMHQLRIPEQAKPYEAKGLWVRTVNKADKSGQQGDYDGFKTNTSGAVLGLDAYPNRGSLVGIAAGYSTSKVKQQDFRLGDEATVQAAHLTLYGSYNFTPELFIGGQVTRSWVDTEGNRSTAIGRVANANFDSGQTSAKIDLGYRIRLMPDSTVFFTPIASFETSTISQDAYVETNAGAIGLSVNSEKFRRTQGGFGLRVEGTTSLGGMIVKPDFFFMATRESGNFAKDVRASYIGDQTNSAEFSTSVLKSTLNSGLSAGFGMGLLLNKTTSMSVRYEYSSVAKARGMRDDAHRSDALDLAIRWNF